MDLRFLKLRLCEADLILVDDLDPLRGGPDWPEAARRVLDRRKGVGAMRMALLSKEEKDFWLRVYDAEGGEEPALFDAALCAARYLLDSGLVGPETLRLRAAGGELAVDILDGSSFGLSLGALLALPEGGILGPELAEERRTLIEAEGERYEALPLGLARVPRRREAAGEEGRWTDEVGGPRAVVFFGAGSGKAPRARIGSSTSGDRPPPALPVRLISRGELRIGGLSDPRLDTLSQAGLAFGAAFLTGHADAEALVRSGGGALWAEMSGPSAVYVAGRPEYVFRGEFHFDEAEELKA